jgi:hypothetical protein
MPKYVAMWNMPGCLPEMEPGKFDTFDDAKDFVLEELHHCAAGTDDCHEQNAYLSAIADVSKARAPFARMAVAYWYSVEAQP